MIDLKLSKVCDVRSPGEWMIEVDAGLEAPVLAAHVLLRIPLAQSLPPIDVRAGTTRGTNALLTRTGAVVGLVTTKGFGDCLEIGEQNRPHLFDLVIRKPAPLTSHIIEVDEPDRSRRNPSTAGFDEHRWSAAAMVSLGNRIDRDLLTSFPCQRCPRKNDRSRRQGRWVQAHQCLEPSRADD